MADEVKWRAALLTLQAGIGAGIRVRRELLFAVCLPSVRCALLRAKVNNSLITDAGGGLATSPAPARLRLQASFHTASQEHLGRYLTATFFLGFQCSVWLASALSWSLASRTSREVTARKHYIQSSGLRLYVGGEP